MSLTPQTTTVLNHLRAAGSITGVEAAACLRVRHLPSKIFELRANGFEVESSFRRDPVGQRYVRYSLRNQKD